MQKSFFSLLHNYTDLENRTAIFNSGPAIDFKSQYPIRHAIYPYIFYPVIAHIKNSVQLLFSKTYLYVFTHLKMC